MTNMPKLTFDQATLQAVREKIAALQKEARDLVAKIAVECTHPSTVDYRWEHDNGYGTQTWLTGDRCVHCGMIKLWKSSTLWHLPGQCLQW